MNLDIKIHYSSDINHITTDSVLLNTNAYTYNGFVREIKLPWILQDHVLALFSLGILVLQIHSESFHVFNTWQITQNVWG